MMRRITVVVACTVVNWLPNGTALAQDDRPVIAVEALTGRFIQADGVENSYFPRQFADLIHTTLLVTPNSCDLRLVEWLRRADAIREVELGQSRFVDPATAPGVGQMLQPDLFLRGTLNSDGTTATWSLQLVVAEGGQVVAEFKGSTATAEIFSVDERIAKQVAEEVCKVEVGYAMAGLMDEATIEGTACGNLDRNFTARSPEVGGTWIFVPGSPDAGTFTYAAADVGGVTGSGQGSYTVVRLSNKAVRIQLSGTGAIHSPLGTFAAEITESIALRPIKTCGRVGDK